MLKKHSWFKVVSINLLLVGVVIIGAELVLRVANQAKISINSPRLALRSIASALLNRGGAWSSHLNHGNVHRMPYPYQMFKGAPNTGLHNYLGYRISDPVTKATLNIALFGGSTGYDGEPPIINLVTAYLNELRGGAEENFKPLNFSVVSSNHNQHLHSLVENYQYYPIDMIIFYGGYNEVLMPAAYGSKPGFPYNFEIRNNASPEEMLAVKHSELYRSLKSRFGANYDPEPFSEAWSQDIVNNYMSVISTARRLSDVLTTGRCKIPFIFVYQPFQMDRQNGGHPSFRSDVHMPIATFADNSQDGIDASAVLDSSVSEYTDAVHVTQAARELIARRIYGDDVFLKAIDSCSK